MDEKKGAEDALHRKIDDWIAASERMQLAEYLQYLQNTRRVFWLNFVSGVMRGLGSAVGFTILGAVVVMILQAIAVRNLPVIGDFFAEIVRIVQKNL